MVARKVKTTLAITSIGSVVSLMVALVLIASGAYEDTAEAGESLEQRRERLRTESKQAREQMRHEQDEWDRRFEEAILSASHVALEQTISESPRRPMRKVRRWVWESPAETRSKLWNVPATEDTAATATGLLRICMTEADGHEADCIGIWQVLKNIRSSDCDRGRIRRITECDYSGETMLSVMRRAQRYALSVIPPRSQRTRWITELELACERPDSYPGTAIEWTRQYSRSCRETSELVRGLVNGRNSSRAVAGSPIAWGGRCESGRGACDDPLACSRGLVRIPTENTANAFWRHASDKNDIDPVCRELGFGRQARGDEVVQADEPEVEVGEI